MFALRASATRSAVASRPAVKRTLALPVQALLKSASKTAQAKRTASQPAERPKGLQLGFTKENELFLGRAAMLGFAFSLIGELLTGKGALGQLGYEIFDNKLNIEQIDELVIGLVLFNLVCAILPTSGTFVPDEEVEQRPPGALQDPRISLASNPFQFLGISGKFGFTKENELFVGRVAQLGFAASLIGETLTGKGPLAQFDFETGIPLQDTEFGLGVFILFLFFAAINPGNGKFVNDDDL